MGIAPEFAWAWASASALVSGVVGTIAHESDRVPSKSISALVEAVGTAVAGAGVAAGAVVGAAVIDEQKMKNKFQ